METAQPISLPPPPSVALPPPPPSQSSFYSVLPASIHSHLPRIPSIRGTLAATGLRRSNSGGSSGSSARRRVSGHGVTKAAAGPLSRSNSGSRKTSRPTSSHSNSSDSSTTSSRTTTPPPPAYMPSEMDAALPTRDMAADKALAPWTPSADQDVAGISWANAAQGLSMLRLCFEQQAAAESTALAKNDASFSLSRNLYVHSMPYLLRALPQDLSQSERDAIKSALPPDVADSAQKPTQPIVIVQQYQGYPQGQGPLMIEGAQRPRGRPSLLHRVTAAATLYLIIALGIAMPYMSAALRALRALEQRHRILERLAALALTLISLAFANATVVSGKLGSRAWGLGRQLRAADDGRLARIAEAAMGWVVLGLSGGFAQGVGEGVGRMGVRMPPAGAGGGFGGFGGYAQGPAPYQQYPPAPAAPLQMQAAQLQQLQQQLAAQGHYVAPPPTTPTGWEGFDPAAIYAELLAGKASPAAVPPSPAAGAAPARAWPW